MIEKTVRIVNRAGMHTRPAAMLVKLASKFSSEVYLERDGFQINAKSIIGVMTLAAEQGSELALQIEGDDEATCSSAIIELFETGFGEQ
ncbi:MAG: HPr family phosphocarrier protein [Ignavibacteria bacterium]|nr:HPr family phosphocarrier protein [Ignavibacteria bacterium]